jgi:hypothetical protein
MTCSDHDILRTHVDILSVEESSSGDLCRARARALAVLQQALSSLLIICLSILSILQAVNEHIASAARPVPVALRDAAFLGHESHPLSSMGL